MLIACMAMLCLSLPAAAKGMPPVDATINGMWDGILTRTTDAGEVKKLAVRLTIDEDSVQVEYQKANGVWKDTMPGLFRIARQGSNAVIQGTNTGVNEETRWVETWIFAVTCQSSDALRVAYLRVVNNVTSPSSEESKSFTSALSGMLTRLTPAMLAAEDSSPIVQITAEASGRFNWRGKSMSATELKLALAAEDKLHAITEVRLLEGDTYPDMKQLMQYAGAVFDGLGLKQAYFERDNEFKTITDGGK
jgi:hypothetical protein